MFIQAAKAQHVITPVQVISGVTVDDFVGPHLSVAALSALGAPYSNYQPEFDTWSDNLYASLGTAWNDAYYYDRALSHYASWKRNGVNALTHRNRAREFAVAYRDGYPMYPGVNGGIPPHWSFVTGLAIHYLDTGDNTSLQCIQLIAVYMWNAYARAWVRDGATTGLSGQEGRIIGRVLQAFLYAKLLGIPNNGGVWVPNTDIGPSAPPWDNLISWFLDKIVADQDVDGSFRADSYCGQQSNFSVCIMMEVLMEYYRLVSPDPRIVTLMVKQADFLATQWNSAQGGFRYISGPCVPALGSSPPDTVTADLNGLIINPIAFAGRYGSRNDLKALAEEVQTQLIPHGAPFYGKQFNQEFCYSFRSAAILHS